jgi:hypothetical protein
MLRLLNTDTNMDWRIKMNVDVLINYIDNLIERDFDGYTQLNYKFKNRKQRIVSEEWEKLKNRFKPNFNKNDVVEDIMDEVQSWYIGEQTYHQLEENIRKIIIVSKRRKMR